MEESRVAGLMMLAAGAFLIVAALANWDWFMNARKARAWVRLIGRDGARVFYGGLGALVSLIGLILVIVAPGQSAPPPVATNQTPPATGEFGDRGAVAPPPDRAVSDQPVGQDADELVTAYRTTPGTSADENMALSNSSSRGSSPVPEARATDGISRPPIPSRISAGRDSEPAISVADDQGVNLLDHIDPARDQLLGQWTKENGVLLSPRDRPALLEIPFAPPDAYVLKAVVERLDGREAISMGLVTSAYGVTAVVDGFGGNFSGLNLVDGKLANFNSTRAAGPFLLPGPNEIIYRVDRESVVVQCNGRTIINWQGQPEQLSFGYEWKMGQPDHLKIGTWESRYRISELRLVPL